MVKELEALKTIKIKCHPNSNPSPLVDEALDTIENALNRLEAIDNANLSEALECLEHIKKDDFNMIITTYPPLPAYNGITKDEMFNKIEQALLKAQEPKQYLKWEDLEFDHKPKYIDVKMGDNKYTLVVGFNVTGCELVILRNKKQQYFFLEADKQFFNDLHLERVEE